MFKSANIFIASLKSAAFGLEVTFSDIVNLIKPSVSKTGSFFTMLISEMKLTRNLNRETDVVIFLVLCCLRNTLSEDWWKIADNRNDIRGLVIV